MKKEEEWNVEQEIRVPQAMESDVSLSSSSSSSSSPQSPLSFCFPCIEQPARVVFRQGMRFLSSNKQGKVFSSKRRSNRDEFVMSPIPGKSHVVVLQSHKFQRFLAVVTSTTTTAITSATSLDDTAGASAYQTLCTTSTVRTIPRPDVMNGDEANMTPIEEDDHAHWVLQREVSTGQVMITSLYNGQSLVCDNNNGSIAMSSPDASTTTTTTTTNACWNVDSVTGELCFLSSHRLDQRIRCDIVGAVSLTDNWKGWEVWRLMESFDGYIRISSWMHSQFLLCCREDGSIATGTFVQSVNDPSCDTEWAISKVHDGSGVVMRSKNYQHLLSVTHDGKLCTVPLQEQQENPGDLQAATIWHIEAAHRQRYTLSTRVGVEGKEISLGPFPFVTANLRQSDEWILEQNGDKPGLVAFRANNSSTPSTTNDDDDVSTKRNKDYSSYLCSTAENGIVLRSKPDDRTELWTMEASTTGGYTFRSEVHGCYLAYVEGVEANGKLVCFIPNTQQDSNLSSDDVTTDTTTTTETTQHPPQKQ